MAQTLQLRRSTRNVQIFGVAIHSVVSFEISPLSSPSDKIVVSAIVVPQVTRDLPIQPIPFKADWSHLSGLYLSDPDFGRSRKIYILLGIDIYTYVMLQGRQSGLFGTLFALETKFGWVLAGKTAPSTNSLFVESHHVTVSSGDDILRKFWEIEEAQMTALPCHQRSLSWFTTLMTHTLERIKVRCSTPKESTSKTTG